MELSSIVASDFDIEAECAAARLRYPELAMFSDEQLAEMVLGTIESPSASASHRPLRLVLDSRSIDDEMHSIAADTGVGCSTMYAEVGLRLGIDPGPVNVSHGAGFSRQVLPRHGAIKQQVKQLPHTLHLEGRLTLHGGMGKRGLSTSASGVSASTMVDSRPLPKKRTRKAKDTEEGDLQTLLDMYEQEAEDEEHKVLAEMGESDEDKESSTPATSEAQEEEEEEAALEEDAAVTPPTPPAAPASDPVASTPDLAASDLAASTPDLAASTPDLAAPAPLPAASDETLSSEKVAPPT